MIYAKPEGDIMFFMRISMILASVLFVGAIGNCQSQMVGYYPKGGADIAAEDVSLIQLIANPQTYDEKTIRVIGFLRLEFEGNVLYLHNEDFLHGIEKNGLWVDLPRDITQEQIRTINNHYVICTAKFVAKMHGHMSMNSGEVSNITRLEVWPTYEGPPPAPPRPQQK